MSENETIEEKTFRLGSSITSGGFGDFETVRKSHIFNSICEIVALAIAEEKDKCRDECEEIDDQWFVGPLFARRARKAECLQWTGENTEEVLYFLVRNWFRGELFKEYIQIYKDNSYCNTLRKTDWIVKQENGEIKFWNDETMKSKYEPSKD